jgi:adenylyltransferase/sulfurtransferase
VDSSERYARQVILPGFGDAGQRRLADARVLVLGAGGLGSAVLPALAGAGVGTLGIVDDDTVELSNLARQTVHGTGDIGRAKTDSAAESVHELNPGVDVVRHPVRFTADNALRIAAGYDVIVDGSDNFPTRYLADDVGRLAGVPVVWGAVDRFGGQASVSWHERGPTYRDLFPTPPPPGSVLSCAEGGVFPATVQVVGALMAAEVLKVLTGIGSPLVGRVTLYDALSGAFRELPFGRDEHAEPITRLADYEAFCGLPSASAELTAAELARILDDVQVVDVREPWEAEIAMLPGARLLPLGSLADAVGALDPGRPVVAYCHHGIRSAAALEVLRANGFPNARHLAGGIDAWAREVAPGMPRY